MVMVSMLASSAIFAQRLQYEPPVIHGYEPPYRSSYRSPFTESNPAILQNNSKMFTDSAIIDFEKRQLTFVRQDAAGNSVWMYHYGELNDYVTDKKNASFYDAWYAKLTEERKQELGQPPAPRLQWELAVHYPPWAQRLLGNDPPRLKIEGRLQLIVAYERTKTGTSAEDEITDIIPIGFETNYDFALHGSVGRLISVNITHSKHDGFDFSDDPLKNFKVEYKESYDGELEDEIIQEIVAGYTGFDMPGTSLSGYSDKHDGLFGIKMRAKIGPLMLTGIASHAQGEALTKELGGKNDPNSMTALRDNEFIRNRYFFVDRLYRDHYNRVNNITNPERNAPPPPRINDTGFQVFVSILCSETTQSTQRRYMADIPGVGELCFRMLDEHRDYTIDRSRGILRFDYNVRDDEMIAITMTTADGSINKGTIVPNNAANNSTQNLELLKPRNMDELTNENPLFGLMWRNVYYLTGIEDGKFELFWLHPSIGDTIRHTPSGQLISRALGLTDDQGRPRTDNTEIFRLVNQELIIPPWNAGENGLEPFANTALGNMADTSIYRLGSRTTAMRDYMPKFGIVTGGSIRRASYDNLGWNILPGTVTVRTNSGTLLIEGEDYELDYQMGIIDLISTRARAAESILITYQRESDFVLERKVFAGLRGEMRLPFISDNSFMAASILYQNAVTSADDIPQLGNEPFSKLHLSFNTSLDFEPEWMTKAVDLLPFVKTQEASAAKVDFEIVHSRMTPNTSKDRAAYIDDFERTRDSYALSLRHPNWYHSHYPFKYTGGVEAIAAAMLDSLRIPAWDIYWFTPNSSDDRNRISRFSVWERDPNNARYNRTDDHIDVLRLHVTPAPASRDVSQEFRDLFRNTYAAITTSFGRNGLNMENHRYVELVVNPRGVGPGGRKGKLMVQIGTFSHDQVRDGAPPNGIFDLEDPTYQNRPELLSQFDRGLNGRDVQDKFYVVPRADRSGWDTLWRNDPRLVFPRGPDNPSGDRFHRYDRDNLNNFRFVNGTWGNSLYDTENIDFDGIPRINFTERYYTYEINLDSIMSPYIDNASRVVGDWRHYRIPLKDILRGASVLKDSASAGGADWAKVRGMRLVWYDFDERMLTQENELLIAGIDLVGNYWEPSPGMEDRIEPSSISNYEDMEYYNSVYGYIVRPRAGEITPEEKSLRLRFRNMSPGDTALVRRNLSFNPQNISGYDSVTVKVYSMANYGDGLKFVMRFGSDDSTYYEYTAPLTRVKGWNEYALSLQALSDLKLTGDIDGRAMDVSRGNLRVVAPSGKRPNFNSITFMAMGVVRGQGGTDSCEIWVNDLIATGARTLTGIAARVNLATQWADFLSLGAGVSYTDGDFRMMTDMPLGTENRSELSANLNAKMKFDKFLPERWGVSIPIGGSISGGLQRPTVKPQSDILLLNDNGKPDGFMDMSRDVLGMMFGKGAEGEQSRAQRFETFSTSQNLYSSFEKSSRSENPLIGFTLDRMKTDISYNMTASVTGRGPHENPDSADYVKTDTTVTYMGNLRYDLSPRDPPSWTSASPFSEVEWLPPAYRKYSLNLLPSTIRFDLAEVQHRTEIRNDARLNVNNFVTRTFDMRHGVQVEYSPINPLLNLTYATKMDRDLSDVPTRNDWEVMTDSTIPSIFGLNRNEDEYWDRYGALYGERGRTQSASARLTPHFVGWMTHNAEYTANYTGMYTRRDNDSTQYLNAQVGTSLRFRNSLLLMELFKKYATKPAPRGGGRGASAPSDTAARDTVPVRKGFMTWLADGVNKVNMRSINFEYDVSTMLKNDFLSSSYMHDTLGMSRYELLKYQLGMRRTVNDYMFGNLGYGGIGWMHHRANTGVEHDLYRNDQSTGNWSARFSTSFIIPEPIRINFTSVSFGWGREFAAQPDTAFIDTTVVFPEVRASASTEILREIGFIKRHLSKLGTTSSASYKHSRRETRDRTDTTTTLEFQPLASFDARFERWPSLSANYRYGRTNTRTATGGKAIDENSQTGLLSTENIHRNTHTFTAVYEFTGMGSLTEIRIRKWVIPVQGKASVGLGVNWENQVKRVRKIAEGGDLGDPDVARERDFNYSPFVTYKFTENIRGEARYLGTFKNIEGRYTNQNRFQLMAEVVF
jgi:hypothetical protein